MKELNKLLCFCCVLILPSCNGQTYEQMALQQRQENINQCQSYGFEYDSLDFKNCMMQVDLSNNQKNILIF